MESSLLTKLENTSISTLKPESFDRLKVIGKGGYAKVFQARKKDNNQIFAMKVVTKPDNKIDENHIKDEIRIFENVKSRFLCEMVHRFETTKKVYMVLEFLPGGELFSLLNREETLEEEAARFYIAQIALALEHLHNNNVVYRDLKPANVMLDRYGHAKLIDFGLSKFNLAKGERTSTFCGTIDYMAPEMLRNGGSYGHSVDIWALGILMYDMVVGGPPFSGETEKEMYANIRKAPLKLSKKFSSECREVIKSLLLRKVENRISISGMKQLDFFKLMDWEKLEAGELEAPFRPEITSDTDVSQFDSCFTDLPPEESPCKIVRSARQGCAGDEEFAGFDENLWFTSDWSSKGMTSKTTDKTKTSRR
ncbi:hypothetical protein CRE_14684 [Caenorhabditis remanei]|uniref:Protein kinase domain-containing protein n=1 Tax=Caenorhabditis remanei TaxID=31234 RepID=E3M9K0_CAERE|nr:hypothetical protein CRE_14684 [Caenorhabditis remanei]